MIHLDRAVGIDLGTTNSEIAWLHPGERDIVLYADKFGRSVIPSAVSFDPKTATFVVGHAARQRRGSAQAPIESVKRKMGQKTQVQVGPHALSPEQVSAKILSELATKMREFLERAPAAAIAGAATTKSVTRAVITVPAYFDAPQVEATRAAGELAGLNVIGILQEPTAAALYHTWKRPELAGDAYYLVYDLGGGTFDVSILRCVAGEYQVLAVEGDNYLGGDDFDRRFAEVLRKELTEKGYALDLDLIASASDREIFQRLVHIAQEVKEMLSSSEIVHVAKNDFMLDKNGEPVSYLGEVSREAYETAIADLVETSIACCERAIEEAKRTAGIDLSAIDHILLVGGSTRVPLVRRRVAERLASHTKNPEPLAEDVDTCVALGAAVHAANLGGLVLDDASQGARVRFTSALTSSKPQMSLGIVVEKAPQGVSRIALWAGDEMLAESPLTVGSEQATRLILELDESPETHATLALQSNFGAAVAELPVLLTRSDARPRPGALTRAAVIAKDIGVEVVRAGKRDRRILLAKGTGLPAQVSHVLFTVDQSETLVLRLLQNRLPIKTLVLEVPRDLPIGSPIELVLSCDDSMRMQARAEVAGVTVQAVVEGAELAAGDDNIDALLTEAERAGRAVWGELGDLYRREADRLTALIREAVRTDPDKLRSLTNRLRDLIEFHRGDSSSDLTPPMHLFEGVVGSLRRIVYRTQGLLVGMTQDQWEKKLGELQARARKAFDASDAVAWKRVNNEAQALLETASVEDWTTANLDDPNYLERRLTSAEAHVAELGSRLAVLAKSSDEVLEHARGKEASRIRAWLTDSQNELARIRSGGGDTLSDRNRQLSDVRNELDRVDVAIDKLPGLGLPTDRGTAPGHANGGA